MDVLTLVLAGLSVAGAVFFFGGVTQPEFGFSLAGLGLAAALYWLVTPKYKRAPADRWLAGGAGALVLWTAIQVKWVSVAPLRTVEYVFTNAAIGTALLLARELGWRFRRQIWVAVVPLLAIAALEGGLGLFQFLAMRAGAGPADSATGTYPNRNHFAGLLEMVLPLALAGGAAFWRGPVKRWWGAAAMLALSGLLIIGTVISLSRMGFLAALGGLFVLGVLLLGGKGRLAAAALVGIVLAVAFVVLPTDEWIARFAAIARTEDISADSRAQIWRDTLPMIRRYWWSGVGMGAYQSAFYQYKNVAPMSTVDYAHNDYLQYLAELGVLGFAAALAVIARCFYWMARGLERSLLVAGAWGAAVAMAIHSLVDFNLYIPANALVLAWIVGTATAPAMTEERRATSE
ncbi:MAG: O-antigen ligase family protein [Acidobacteria bacterium]|nr:O-antigen ligase family protein [Acidobacteriota bacterium]